MGEFRMPSLGADMDAGTVIEWLVHVGDEVHRGDIVAVVDTDKADIDVEIFEGGVVDELLVPVGVKVPVGTPLARLRATDEAPTAAAPTAAAPTPAPPVAAPAPAPSPTPTAAPSPAVVPVAPLAHGAASVHSPVLRRLAAHLGVDLDTVHGTGPEGRITRADVEAAAAAPTPTEMPAPTPAGAPAAGERDRAAAMRRAIGELMARSSREIPHYYVSTDVDAGALVTWLERTNAARPVTARLLPAAVLLKAAAVALHDVPALNGFWTDGEPRPSPAVHLGVAVRLRGGGLIAPALHDADQLPLDELMRRLQDLVSRARSGHLRSSEMSDPTFTVTQLGDQGVDEVLGVIYPPQVALLGLGRITERPWAVGGLLGVRPVLRATLAGDHRATDGMDGARYLRALDRLLQRPEEL